MNGIEIVLTKPRDGKVEPVQTDSDWRCQCPAHDDHKASPSLAESEDGRVLVTACDAAAVPTGVCDTPPFPRQSSSTHPITAAASEDYAVVYLKVRWNAANQPFEALDSAKQAAIDSGAPEPLQTLAHDFIHLLIHPAGSSSGGKRPTHFRWRGSYGNSFVIEFANFSAGMNSAFNVRITCSGRHFMHATLGSALQTARNLIAKLSGLIIEEILSRVDMAIDLLGLSIDPFKTACDEGRYTCGCDPEWYEGKGKSIVFQHGTLLRIYDKLRQLDTEKKWATRHDMIHSRWGGTEPQEAIRIEFQCRRSFLKRRGISVPLDYQLKRQALIRDLCEEFRFTARPVDRVHRNHSRADTMPLWAQISAAWQSLAASPDHDLTPVPKAPVDVRNLEKQLVGLARSIARRCSLDDTHTAVLNQVWAAAARKYGPGVTFAPPQVQGVAL